MLKVVKAPGAKPPLVQKWEMINWGARLIATPIDYRLHRMYMKGFKRKDALRFLSGMRGMPLIWSLNRDVDLLENKLLYEQHFGAAGLPVPKTLAVTGAVGDLGAVGEVELLGSAEAVVAFLTERLSAGTQLAVKPIAAGEGVGVSVIKGIEGGNVVFSTGEKKDLADFASELAQEDDTRLIQERLAQHPDFDQLNASSLNTMRLHTFRRKDGEVKILFPVLRIGSADAQRDNYAHGGYGVAIDPVTGAFSSLASRMTMAAQMDESSIEHLPEHSDSGATFAGRSVPYWDQIQALAPQFAKLAGDNIFIGWDVAITPTGPVFTEGNHDWDFQFAQDGTDGLLTDEVLRLLREDAGIDLDVSRPPRPRPLYALKALLSRWWR